MLELEYLPIIFIINLGQIISSSSSHSFVECLLIPFLLRLIVLVNPSPCSHALLKLGFEKTTIYSIIKSYISSGSIAWPDLTLIVPVVLQFHINLSCSPNPIRIEGGTEIFRYKFYASLER